MVMEHRFDRKVVIQMTSRVTLHHADQGDKEVLRNLLSLYLHDLSEFLDTIEVNETGRFEFDVLDMYFESPIFHPILLRVDGQLAGFILLTEAPYVKPGCDYCIQEFFIVKTYRGQGVGTQAVGELYRIFPGTYFLVVLEKNQVALHFWRTVHARYRLSYEEGMTLTAEGKNCYFHIFQTS